MALRYSIIASFSLPLVAYCWPFLRNSRLATSGSLPHAPTAMPTTRTSTHFRDLRIIGETSLRESRRKPIGGYSGATRSPSQTCCQKRRHLIVSEQFTAIFWSLRNDTSAQKSCLRQTSVRVDTDFSGVKGRRETVSSRTPSPHFRR